MGWFLSFFAATLFLHIWCLSQRTLNSHRAWGMIFTSRHCDFLFCSAALIMLLEWRGTACILKGSVRENSRQVDFDRPCKDHLPAPPCLHRDMLCRENAWRVDPTVPYIDMLCRENSWRVDFECPRKNHLLSPPCLRRDMLCRESAWRVGPGISWSSIHSLSSNS